MPERRDLHVATGKRKSAVARVRMHPGEGKIVMNDRPLEDYFGRETSRMIVNQPFDVTETRGQYDATVNVGGGGVAAQATAIRHGITRALCKANPGLRSALKRAGFVTRDARRVERKKYGQPGARKRFQFCKR